MRNLTALLPTRWGHMVALTCDPYQTGSLMTYGEWARDESEMICSFLQPGDVALDIGANIGTLAVAMAHKVGPTGSVLAFEPQRPCYYCLCGNAALTNTLRQLICFHSAVSDGSSPTIEVPAINLIDLFNVGGMRLNDPAYAAHSKDMPTESVRCIAIDALGMMSVDMIKIDVETMEGKVLLGAEQTIARCRPVIIAEAIFLDCGEKENANLEEMKSVLLRQNYDARFLKTMLFSKDNIRHATEQMFPDGDRNIVAIPNEEEKPDWFLKLPVV